MILGHRKGVLRKRFERYLAKDKKLQKVVRAIQRDFAQSGLTAHNWEHIYRDALNAIVIGEAEGADMSIVLPAIIMHDIGLLYYYGATGKTHGAVGAQKLPIYLKKIKVAYSRNTVSHIAGCIRTHKGSMHNERPATLEAKVVADADLLEKFGLFGVYQSIRTFGEFDLDIETIIKRGFATRNLYLETRTGQRLARRGFPFVLAFFKKLDEAYDPYR